MKARLLVACLACAWAMLCLPTHARAAEDGYWRMVDAFAPEVAAREAWVRPKAGARAELNPVEFQRTLRRAPMEEEGLTRQAGTVIVLPMPDSTLARFEVVEAPVMAPKLQARFPEMRTYVGRGLDDPGASVRIAWTPRGLAAQILAPRGTICVDPFTRDDVRAYSSYYVKDFHRDGPAGTCEANEGPGLELDHLPGVRSGTPRVGDTRRTYRLALAATAEYTAMQGGTSQAMSAITTLVNNLNGVYEIEANIRFQLVANNDLLIQTNALTDPYTNSNNSTMLGENQTAVDSIIGGANYDVGHVFGTANGGVATVGVVCTAGLKARGVSASPFAVTDPYTVQTFCHEMGHQFNARHTFNGNNGSCTSGQRSGSDAFEPGSGSTLMSYAGFCGADNVITTVGELYLNAQSFDRIANWAAGFGGCAASSATGNTPPDVDAGPDHAIPAFTPFELAATGSDVDADTVTYCWEQRDLGPAQALAAGDMGSGPIIRSRAGTTSGHRSVPTLANVLSGGAASGEIVPTTSRTLSFRVTARDHHAGAGGVSIDDAALQVVGAAGPFRVTSPNTNVSWGAGSHTITWDVAGTTAAPILCANVRILLSIDGGATFPTILTPSVSNSGSAIVTIPEAPTSQARIRLEPVGNVFYDVSDVNFTVLCPAPVGVVASDDHCDRVTVSWSPVTGATGYSVWRGITASPGAATLLGSASGTTFDDATAASGSTHFYFVRAIAPTISSDLSTPDAGTRTSLPAVANVAATTGLCDRVDLSWDAATPGATYEVLRNTVDSTIGGTVLGTSATTTYSDTTGAPGEAHFYFVRVSASVCDVSPFSTGAPGQRGITPPLPTGVAASDLASCDHVEVSWSASAGAATYDVLRNTVDDALTAIVIASPATPSFTDTTVLAGIPHYYFVRATNTCGTSNASAPDTGTRTQSAAFTAQPQLVTVCPGEEAHFMSSAAGTGPISYAWFLESTPVGTDSPALTLTGLTLADNGKMVRCEATNVCGMAISDTALLRVRVCGPVIYVDASAPPAGDGAAWSSAHASLPVALAHAVTEPTITTIKVAAGTYRPSGTADRSAAFAPRAGLTLLAGYPPGGGPDESRDPRLHPVTLSGDLGADDGPAFSLRTDNSLRVLHITGGSVVLEGVRIRGGSADGTGGVDSGAGVRVEPGAALTLRDCHVLDNLATAQGGGIGCWGAVTIERVTISGNRAAQGGGVVLAGLATLTNCTIAGNEAQPVLASEGGGGVLVAPGASATLRHCTVALNSAAGGSGGGVLRMGGTLDAAQSVFADNAALDGVDVWGDLGSTGYNLVRSAAGVLGTVGTDILGVNPRLLALADNGGMAPTIAPGQYSRVIDGAPEPCGGGVDQRNIARPIAGIIGGVPRCDLGALEMASSPALCAADIDDGTGTNYPDGAVDIGDLLYFLDLFETGNIIADLDDDGDAAVSMPDGATDINDLLFFLARFESGC